eukprot:3610483-Pleurochrysis_carterae.AAC.1
MMQSRGGIPDNGCMQHGCQVSQGGAMQPSPPAVYGSILGQAGHSGQCMPRYGDISNANVPYWSSQAPFFSTCSHRFPPNMPGMLNMQQQPQPPLPPQQVQQLALPHQTATGQFLGGASQQQQEPRLMPQAMFRSPRPYWADQQTLELQQTAVHQPINSGMPQDATATMQLNLCSDTLTQRSPHPQAGRPEQNVMHPNCQAQHLGSQFLPQRNYVDGGNFPTGNSQSGENRYRCEHERLA